MTTRDWDIYIVSEVRDWIEALDGAAYARVVQAIDLLAEEGPWLGRPLVDTIHGSSLANLKELRRQGHPMERLVQDRGAAG
jgi:hypothetical protein